MSKLQAIEKGLYICYDGAIPKYVFRKQHKGKQIYKVLGTTTDLSLADARVNAALMLSDLRTGRLDSVSTVDTNPLFADILEKALAEIFSTKEYKKRETEDVSKSEHQWRQTLADYAMPVLQYLRVRDIKQNHILSIVSPIWKTRNETAYRLVGRLSQIFVWCINNGFCDSDPADWRLLRQRLAPRAKVRTVKHHEAPTYDELKLIVKYCQAHPGLMSGATLLIIAAAGRVCETRYAKWDEFDFEQSMWSIPPENQKVVTSSRECHYVPLSRLAMLGINQLKKLNGHRDHICYSSRTDDGLMSQDSPRQLCMRAINRKVTAHGIRSTFIGWCEKEGVAEVVAERSLMHRPKGSTNQAYHRESHYDERVEVMDAWADFLLE